jgi:uncharacterized protein (DUF1499 family)
VANNRFSPTDIQLTEAPLPPARYNPSRRKNIFATECSNPQATKALMRNRIARILSVTPRATIQSQTAKQLFTLHKIPRKVTFIGLIKRNEV